MINGSSIPMKDVLHSEEMKEQRKEIRGFIDEVKTFQIEIDGEIYEDNEFGIKANSFEVLIVTDELILKL